MSHERGFDYEFKPIFDECLEKTFDYLEEDMTKIRIVGARYIFAIYTFMFWDEECSFKKIKKEFALELKKLKMKKENDFMKEFELERKKIIDEENINFYNFMVNFCDVRNKKLTHYFNNKQTKTKNKRTCYICYEKNIDKYVFECDHRMCIDCMFAYCEGKDTLQVLCPFCKRRSFFDASFMRNYFRI